MTDAHDAILPLGNSSVFSGISENFSFHSSPESFIAKAVLRHQEQHPESVQSRAPVRAKILNRNVAIVAAYDHVKHVLEHSQDEAGSNCPRYVAGAPYDQLMQDFFPWPNLLLNDGAQHRDMKAKWKAAVSNLESGTYGQTVCSIIHDFVAGLPRDTPIDLYNSLKNLAWHILLSRFLDLNQDDQHYYEVVQLQEVLLRGQFSLFPVSVNAGVLWKSPRKKGIEARERLQSIIAGLLAKKKPTWIPEDMFAKCPQDEIVNHMLMATSSLAVKSLASLLLAFLSNTYLGEDGEGQMEGNFRTPTTQATSEGARAILLETARLSPPVVGIMRRTTKDTVLETREVGGHDTLLPKDWDVWFYFPGANRDPATFGEDADRFRPGRYLTSETTPVLAPEPIIFGLGQKKCLGADFVTTIALEVHGAFQKNELGIEGQISAPGVRGWLGWQVASPEQWATDMKQLPTQRPAKAIKVRVVSINSHLP